MTFIVGPKRRVFSHPSPRQRTYVCGSWDCVKQGITRGVAALATMTSQMPACVTDDDKGSTQSLSTALSHCEASPPPCLPELESAPASATVPESASPSVGAAAQGQGTRIPPGDHCPLQLALEEDDPPSPPVVPMMDAYLKQRADELDELRRRNGASCHPEVAETLNSMGLYYHFVHRDWRRSLSCHQEALAVLQRGTRDAHHDDVSEERDRKRTQSNTQGAQREVAQLPVLSEEWRRVVLSDEGERGHSASSQEVGPAAGTKRSRIGVGMPQKHSTRHAGLADASHAESGVTTDSALATIYQFMAITHTDIGNAHKLSGTDASSLGRAMSSYECAMEIYRTVLRYPDDHPRVAATLRFISNVNKKGQYQGVVDVQTQGKNTATTVDLKASTDVLHGRGKASGEVPKFGCYLPCAFL